MRKKKPLTKKRKQSASNPRKRKGSSILEIQSPSTSNSTSNDLIQSSTESIDSIQQSTSTEIIPFPPASTSTEIIPYASTSTEIIPSTEDPQLWRSMLNEIRGNSFPLEISISQAFNIEERVCVFCIYQYNEISRNMYTKNIRLCPKHLKAYACIVENCYTVFPNKGVFIEHYCAHLNMRNTDSLCRKCMLVLTSPSSTTSNHTHQTLSDFFNCCSQHFQTMHQFVVHKLTTHETFVVSAHNRSPILNNSAPFFMSLPKCKIEPIDSKDDVLLTTTVVQNEVNEVNEGGEREGSYKCKNCSVLFFTLIEYVEHYKKQHNKKLTLKESGIQLCPLCDTDFLCYNFVEHVEKCTNTMKLGDKKLNHFGCVYCKVVFTKLSASIFRKHVLFCRTFKVKCFDNVAYKSCINCNFQTADDNLAVTHANNECIYFQLKMRYAIRPNEKQKVIDRMNLLEEYSKGQLNKNCIKNKILPSTSKEICDSKRRRMLKWYNYYCFNCNNAFFDKHIFYYHLNGSQSVCRPSSLIYCTRCVNDFNCERDYTLHLPNSTKPAPLLSIKSEEIDPSYYAEDVIMDSTVVHPNQSDDEDAEDIKVFEMNGIRPFQEQTITMNDIISNAQFQEQEISNYDNTDQEMEFSSNDEYMQCVIEEKPDLNQIMMDNNMQ